MVERRARRRRQGGDRSPSGGIGLARDAWRATDCRPERLQTTIAARRFDLYDEPMATLADLEAYADGASSSLIALAAQILERRRRVRHRRAQPSRRAAPMRLPGCSRRFPSMPRAVSSSCRLNCCERHGADRQDVRVGRATPQLRAALADLRGSARRHLRQAQDTGADACRLIVMPALLPVALAGATLARMERRDYDPFVPVEIAPWRRQWLIWRAARRPARIFARTQIGRGGCGGRRRCGRRRRVRCSLARSADRSDRPGSWRRAAGFHCAPRRRRARGNSSITCRCSGGRGGDLTPPWAKSPRR